MSCAPPDTLDALFQRLGSMAPDHGQLPLQLAIPLSSNSSAAYGAVGSPSRCVTAQLFCSGRRLLTCNLQDLYSDRLLSVMFMSRNKEASTDSCVCRTRCGCQDDSEPGPDRKASLWPTTYFLC